MVGESIFLLQKAKESPSFQASFISFAKGTVLSLVLSLFFLFPAHALASTAVTPDEVNVVAGHEQLTIYAPYADDSNNNSTLTVSWALSGTDWADVSVQSALLEHQNSAFSYKIEGLQNFTSYQLRVEFHDDEGISNTLGVQIVPSVVPYNPMVHNSYTTGSLKWSAQNGWGLPNSKYGEFSCDTCHAKRTGNIKRIKTDIEVTDALNLDLFPIQQDAGTITFLNANKGTSDFGDDARIPSNQSTNICEGCHSQNKFHNYDTANNLATDHYNRDTCTGCHEHSAGFKASCGACHPEEPDAASHDEHFNSAILNQDFACQSCHATSIHMNSLSEVRFDASRDILNSAIYSEEGGDETSCYTEADGYCVTPSNGSCNNLYCHSNADPLAGTNSYSNPTWGGAPMQCDSCHDPAGGTQAMSSPHGRHTDPEAYAYACDKCHSDTVSGSDTIVGADFHVNKQKDVALAVTGLYNSATNECSTVYCHSDGRSDTSSSPSCLAVFNGCHYVDLDNDGIKETSTGDKTTSASEVPDWANAAGYGCSSCHKGRPGLEPISAQMDSNGHMRLVNEHWIRQYACSYCHYQTVDASGAIKFTDGTHVNEQVDIAFDPKWDITGYPKPSYNASTMVCDNLYCHSDGTAEPEVRAFPWNRTEHAKCDSCHGHELNDDCTACHKDGAPDVSLENQWKMAMPMYNNTGVGTSRANSHMRHLETEFACENCHRATVVGSCNTIDCHDGGVPDGDMGEVEHVFAEFHVNTIKDVVFKDGGSYTRATKSCSNTACHTGTTDPRWGDSRNGTILCLSCHGTTEADIDDYGSFNGTQAKINLNEWVDTGHGRPLAAGNYTSGNAPANFPGNPCWYCHDNEVLHKDDTNPYRLRQHNQFERRFEKECVYCHMERKSDECWGCHDSSESLSVNHQLANLTGIDPDDGLPYTRDHAPYAGNDVNCLTSACHLPQEADKCRDCHDNPADTSGALQLDDAVVRLGMADVPYKISEIQVGMSASPYAADHIEFNSGGLYQGVSCMSTSAEWPPTGCHSSDVHIHNSDSGVWTNAQKLDVENQYMMMGVCLQCHDDDSNDRCNSCHTWSGAEEDNPYKLGFDPGTGFIKGASTGSSSHFGYKHFQAYESSQSDIVVSGTVSETAVVNDQLKDDSQSWSDNQWQGEAVRITSGIYVGEIRPILVNGYNSLTLRIPFTAPLDKDTTYDILNTAWKGGKFCWDCHDPHGDGNIYMIHDEVTTESDGAFGLPQSRATVSFTRTQSGLDYAQSSTDNTGICNVCHTTVDHYQANAGDSHRSNRRCTDCHNHGFTSGHGSNKACDSCHDQKPVPNHLGFGQPRDCTKCHEGVINKRTDIMRQFRGQSHHVQGIEVTNEHCYQCHWESTRFGLINTDRHAGYNYKTHESAPNAKDDLVIWGPEGRPERYELDVTAVIFNAVTIGTGLERENVADVTSHCLGCHSEQHNDTDIFGDCKTPRQYAWDRTSIAERYLNPGVTNWGKYSGIANAAKKIQQKAYSAHGQATLNSGGWSPADGEDGTLPNNRPGGENVQCYDCHNSHGSFTKGITSSYLTFDNTYNGANLKETQAGKGGYNVTYQAKEVKDEGGIVNPMNPGAAQCFDCHETENAGAKPWGYNSTFGALLPIQSYRDSLRFAGGPTGHKDRFPYRSGMMSLGGHLKASTPLATAATKQINGLCSGCHDPHGVSPSLGDDRDYAVPLLKGTWLTSPYKDDQPQVATNQRSSNFVYSDRKTFGTTDGTSFGPSLSMTEDAEKFAGLCLRCHPKGNLTDGINKNTAFKTTDRIHETVKGWGNNAEHNYSCSKCHNAHSSGLGRLMRTNCLNVTHRGQVESGGVPGSYSAGTYSYPRTAYYYGGAGWQPACHNSAGAGGGAWNAQEWNMVTPW